MVRAADHSSDSLVRRSAAWNMRLLRSLHRHATAYIALADNTVPSRQKRCSDCCGIHRGGRVLRLVFLAVPLLPHMGSNQLLVHDCPFQRGDFHIPRTHDKRCLLVHQQFRLQRPALLGRSTAYAPCPTMDDDLLRPYDIVPVAGKLHHHHVCIHACGDIHAVSDDGPRHHLCHHPLSSRIRPSRSHRI